MEFEDDGSKILDGESINSFSNKEDYSRNYLLMLFSERCLRNLSKEFIAGYFNERVDRLGNLTKTYIPDSRLEFIGSIKAFDKLVKPYYNPIESPKKMNSSVKILGEKIKILKEKIDKIKFEHLTLEASDWESTPKSIRDERLRKGIFYRKGVLNKNLPYYQSFIEEQTEIFEYILENLMEITIQETKKAKGDEINFTRTEIDVASLK